MSDLVPGAGSAAAGGLQFGLYADFENLWIQNRKSLFPKYDWRSDAIDGVPITPEQRSAMNKALREFIPVFGDIVADTIGCSPRWKHAFAVWEKLDNDVSYSNQIKSALTACGYHVHPPMHLPPSLHAKRESLKEASDRELSLKLIDGIVFRKEVGLNAILLCTGDHYGARLAHFVREHHDVPIDVASFSRSLSHSISQFLREMTPKRDPIIIDKHPIYEAYAARVNGMIPPVVSIDDPISSMVRSAIAHRYRTKYPFISPNLFHSWVEGWIQHIEADYKQPLPSDTAHWVGLFTQRGIIRIVQKRRPNGTLVQDLVLCRECQEVADAIAEIDAGYEVYEKKWRISPPRPKA